MEHVSTSLRFTTWALEAVVLLPPISVVFALSAVSLVWAGFKQHPFKAGHWPAHYWLVFTHAAFFIAAIVIAVLGANPITNPVTPHAPMPLAKHCLDVVMFCSVGSCVFWIWRMKGLRWFATSLMLVAEAISYGAFFIATMSITGDWL